MAFGTNIKIDVSTYNMSSIGYLYNHNPLIQLTNKKFKDFETTVGQKGTTVRFDIPPTVDFIPSLGIPNFGGYTQKEFPLTVDQEGSVPTGVPNLERLFNFDHTGMMTPIAMSAVAELSTRVGKNVAQNFVDRTYFTFGDGTDSILSFQSLNQAVMNFDDMGTPSTNDMCMVIPTTASAAITGQGLSQFVMNRNEDIASTWYVASIGAVDVYHSNLLPKHIAGSVGQAGTTLTVVSVSGDGSQVTFSGAAVSDADAIKAGDIITFQDNLPGQELRYLTYYGQVVSGQRVQIRAVNDAASDGSGNVVVDVDPPLNGSGERDANINIPVPVGIEATALNSHVCGAYFSKSAFMMAMPKLGSTSPFEYSSLTDKDGVSMRVYNGFFTDSADTGYVHQVAWGSYLVGRYAMRLAFPL